MIAACPPRMGAKAASSPSSPPGGAGDHTGHLAPFFTLLHDARPVLLADALTTWFGPPATA
jgi:hypothetical protein